MPSSGTETVIRPQVGFADYLKEVWRYRQVVWFLAWRDILVRYKQTILGVVWVMLRPALAAIILSLVFGRVARLDSGEVPYVLFVLVTLLPWQFVMSALGMGSVSVVSAAHMITRIYFPRILLPMSVMLVQLLDFIVTLPVLAATMMLVGYMPAAGALWAVPVMLLIVGIAFGLAAILAALNASYRDVTLIVPFALQLGLFVSPIAYGLDMIPERYLAIYCLNPLAGLFDLMRFSILGTSLTAPGWALVWAVFLGLATPVLGIFIFVRRESRFVDEV